MAKYLFWIFVAVIIIALGIYFFAGNQSSDSSITGATAKKVSSGDENVKIFVLSGENFKFLMNGVENPEIRVNQGDRVRVELVVTEGFHDFVIDELNVATKKLNPGGIDYIEFIADKKGTFEYYCSVGEHRAMGMKGVFVVE